MTNKEMYVAVIEAMESGEMPTEAIRTEIADKARKALEQANKGGSESKADKERKAQNAILCDNVWEEIHSKQNPVAVSDLMEWGMANGIKSNQMLNQLLISLHKAGRVIREQVKGKYVYTAVA